MVVNDRYESGTRPRTPVHLWIIGVLALLWNMMGAFDYLATKLQLDFWVIAIFLVVYTWSLAKKGVLV